MRFLLHFHTFALNLQQCALNLNCTDNLQAEEADDGFLLRSLANRHRSHPHRILGPVSADHQVAHHHQNQNHDHDNYLFTAPFYSTIFRGDYVYPGWANGIGWLIAMTAILSVPLMAVITVVAAYRRRPDEGLMAAFNRLRLLLIFSISKLIHHQ